MPTNAGPEFAAAQQEFQNAKTSEEKIRCLNKMYALSPKHKSSEGLLMDIKTKISKLREKQEKEKAAKKGGYSLSVKKEGAAQVALVGLTNSGKSTILARFTNAKPEIADYEYTTKTLEIGVMDYHSVKIQLIEIPAIFDGFIDSPNGPSFFNIIRGTDFLVVVLDTSRDCDKDLELIESEFNKHGLTLKKIKQEKTYYTIINCIVVLNKVMKNFKSKYRTCWVDDFKEAVWNNLGLIYAFTKQPGREKEYPPVALKKGSTVKDLAQIVHKDFVKRFKRIDRSGREIIIQSWARIWGTSVKHQGQRCGFEHVLAENDIVELHLGK